MFSEETSSPARPLTKESYRMLPKDSYGSRRVTVYREPLKKDSRIVELRESEEDGEDEGSKFVAMNQHDIDDKGENKLKK